MKEEMGTDPKGYGNGQTKSLSGKYRELPWMLLFPDPSDTFGQDSEQLGQIYLKKEL
jgi:hypothetical protein